MSHQPPTVMLALTAHGFGHATQAAPVFNRLRRQLSDLRLVIVADIPRAWLEQWFDGEFELISQRTDPGMRMQGPLHVDIDATVRAYDAFRQQTGDILEMLQQHIREKCVDLVVADVPWLPLVAARREQCPAVALCSLNWVDILEPLLPTEHPLSDLLDDMRTAYQSAHLFIRPEPAMPMTWLQNLHSVGHISRVGRQVRPRILQALGLPQDQRLAILQFGGEAGDAPLKLPQREGLTWLVAGQANIGGDQVSTHALLERLQLRFVDLVASADLMLTKPGYSSFAEAASHGLPVLSVIRDDWPESPWLVRWLSARVPLREIGPDALARGDFEDALEELLSANRPAGLLPDGIDAAVADLLAMI